MERCRKAIMMGQACTARGTQMLLKAGCSCAMLGQAPSCPLRRPGCVAPWHGSGGRGLTYCSSTCFFMPRTCCRCTLPHFSLMLNGARAVCANSPRSFLANSSASACHGFLKLSRATSAKPALRHCRLEIAQTTPGNSTVPMVCPRCVVSRTKNPFVVLTPPLCGVGGSGVSP